MKIKDKYEVEVRSKYHGLVQELRELAHKSLNRTSEEAE
jgi:hypothetical protein